MTLLIVARCRFNVDDDSFLIFFLFAVLFTTVRRLTGLKLGRSDTTAIWSWKISTKINIFSNNSTSECEQDSGNEFAVE